jgi:hypothetical protein
MRTFLALVVILLAGCRYELDETLRATPTPNEKNSVFPPPPARAVITQLAGPESVLHDPEQDVYFISNINGGLAEVDGNGFITRVDAASLKVDLQWVGGLDAPKGMAIVGDTLYVSDVRAIRKFDRRSGAPQGRIELAGATLINDITTDGTNLYVSDTGIRVGPGVTFRSTGTDTIWKIAHDQPEKLASGPVLRQPNGLSFARGRLHVASFQGDEIYQIDEGRIVEEQRVPKGQLDGLLVLDDGTRIVTSWMGSAIYRDRGDGKFEAILTGLASPADIGYDAKRRLLLVPRSPDNQVTIHSLPHETSGRRGLFSSHLLQSARATFRPASSAAHRERGRGQTAHREVLVPGLSRHSRDRGRRRVARSRPDRFRVAPDDQWPHPQQTGDGGGLSAEPECDRRADDDASSRPYRAGSEGHHRLSGDPEGSGWQMTCNRLS